jgi:hypothetical protein
VRLEVALQRRHGLGRIATHQQDGFGARDVLERKRKPPIHAEGAVGGRGGRGHAEASVVVDAGAAERHAGELAEQVGLFVRERAAAEDADSIPSVAGLSLLHRVGDASERLAPADRTQSAARVARQRSGEPLRVAEQARRRPALDAERAFVHRKLGVAVERRSLRRTLEDGAALQRAVGAVALHASNQDE